MTGGMQAVLAGLVAGVLALAALSGGAVAKVIGRDDRKPLPPKLERVLGNAIGLLVYRLRDEKGRLTKRWATCTATCVGKHTILTAAHCVMRVPRLTKYTPDLGTMRFILWPGDKKRALPFDLAGFPTDANRRRFMLAGPGNVTAFNGARPLDWALLPLERTRACPVRLRMAPVDTDNKRLREGRPLMLVGFHGDLLKRGIRKLRYSLCHARADAFARRIIRREKRRTGQSVLVHDCDATKGASGSPMLVKKGGKLYIAAVLSGDREFRRDYRSRRTGRIVKRKILRRQNEAAPAENIIPALKKMRARGKVRDILPALFWQERLMAATGLLLVYKRDGRKWQNMRACTAICTGRRHVAVPTSCIADARNIFLNRLIFLSRPHMNEKGRVSRAVVEDNVMRETEQRAWTVLALLKDMPVCRPAVVPVRMAPPPGKSGTVFVAGYDVCRNRKFEDVRLRQVTCRGVIGKEIDGQSVALDCQRALPSGGGVLIVADRRRRPRLLGMVAPFSPTLLACASRAQRRTATGKTVSAEMLSTILSP